MRRMTLTTLVLVLVIALFAPSAPASDNTRLAELDTSLNRVPDDVAFYYGMFRAGEQVELIGNSKAWAKLQQSETTKLFLAEMRKNAADTEGSPVNLTAILENPQYQDLLTFLGDVFDDDAFLYADKTFKEWAALSAELEPLKLNNSDDDAEDKADGDDTEEEPSEEEKARQKEALALLAKRLDIIKIPTFVVGAKLEDTRLAKIQLGKLELLLDLAIRQMTEMASDFDFRETFKHEKISGSDFLVLRFPLKNFCDPDEITFTSLEEDENGKKILDKLMSESLVIAIGVKGDYLLMSIGSSVEELERFGQDRENALVSRLEMGPIEPYADKPITSISYRCKEMFSNRFVQEKEIEQMLTQALELIGQAELDEAEEEQLTADVQEFAELCKKTLPKPGAASSVSYRTPTGMERYSFSWDTGIADGKPLDVLNHVGGSPLLVIASVCPFDIETYDTVSHWVGVGCKHFENGYLSDVSEEERANYQKVLDLFGPTVKAFHKTTREKLLPAYGGTFALLADAKTSTYQFPDDDDDKKLPLPEPGLVFSVKDKKLMDEALVDYSKMLKNFLDTYHQMALEENKKSEDGEESKDIDELKDLQLPTPSVIESKSNKMYVFKLPEPPEIEETPELKPIMDILQPTVGVGEDALVFTLTTKSAKHLMQKTPWTGGGILADMKKPRIVAFHLSWKDLVATARPWILRGVEEELKNNDDEAEEVEEDAEAEDNAEAEEAVEETEEENPWTPDIVLSEVNTFLDILSVLQSVSVEQYRDGKMTVTHSQVIIRDIE